MMIANRFNGIILSQPNLRGKLIRASEASFFINNLFYCSGLLRSKCKFADATRYDSSYLFFGFRY